MRLTMLPLNPVNNITVSMADVFKSLLRTSYLWLVYIFLYVPIIILVIYSFNASKRSLTWGGFSLQWYETLWNNKALVQVALNSVTLAVLAATLATLLGTFTAIVLYRYQFFGKAFLQTLIFILIMSPDIVMGISLMVLFVGIQMPLGFWTLLIAHITFCVPFVVVTALGRLSDFDENLMAAAHDLGASEWQAFYHVLLPLLMPAMIAGWLLSFTLSMDDVIVSFFVTGPAYETLPLYIYSMVRLGVKPEINALCSVMFGITLLLVLIAQLLLWWRR